MRVDLKSIEAKMHENIAEAVYEAAGTSAEVANDIIDDSVKEFLRELGDFWHRQKDKFPEEVWEEVANALYNDILVGVYGTTENSPLNYDQWRSLTNGGK